MSAPKSISVKILSYNIHKGMDLLGRKNVIQKIKQAIRDVEADIVCLQEVLGSSKIEKHKHNDWPSANQFEYLADQIWPHFAYGKNAVFSDRDYGNAILSKFPIIRHERIDTSTNKYERRGLLHAICDIPGTSKPFEVICLHNDLLERGRNLQIDKLVDRIAAHTDENAPLVICGDFNDWLKNSSKRLRTKLPIEEAHAALHGNYARTFPAFFPVLQLDRIYFRNLKPLKSFAVAHHPWSKLSDHAALYAEFELSQI